MTSSYRHDLLRRVYGADSADAVSARLEDRLEREPVRDGEHRAAPAPVWVISYADQFQAASNTPLVELHRLLSGQLADHIDGVHILPFYPWSSDGGFAVEDYEQVDPRYGTWRDVEALSDEFTVMFDAVINHMSAESPWFEQFLAGDPKRAGFFRTGDPSIDTSEVVRPRTHPLFTAFDRPNGEVVHVWTTFSADQVDLDYANPDVLLRIVDVLLGYATHGAGAIRLDAIGFLWKDESTSSIHLPGTHDLIKLLRSCLDQVAPGTLLISETNVPHAENISYLDEAEPEVHAVYQFPLAPLVAHAVLTGESDVLKTWAAEIDDIVGEDRTFLNFLASHDGIGVRPVEGLLSVEDLEVLTGACLDVGGQISYRSLPDGSTAPYELNTTWLDLMAHGVDEDLAIARHLAAHAVMLALPGIAAIYVHSLFGSSNDVASFEKSGHRRDLNRQRFTDVEALEKQLATEGTRERVIFDGLGELIRRRKASPAFHREGRSLVLDSPPGTFAIERRYGDEVAVCLVNLSNEPASVEGLSAGLYDLITGEVAPAELAPYASAWLRP